MATSSIKTNPQVLRGVILCSDLGDIPANITNFEITLPVSLNYVVTGAFVYYGNGNTVNWLIRNRGSVTVIRLANLTSGIISKNDWSFCWIATPIS